MSFDEHGPCDLPEPRAMAARLVDRAWADDIDDDDRELLELAARLIEALLARLAAVSEHAEARRKNTRR